MEFNQKEFNDFVIRNNIIGFFEEPITLKSGQQSHLYVNWRRIAEDAFLMDQLTDYVLNFTKATNINVDTFYGVAEGATKLGILTQFKYAQQQGLQKGSHQLAMGRAKPKEHGDPADRFFVGQPTGNICILEDVTTTGNSLIECVKQLQELNLNIIAAIGLTNRNQLRSDNKTVAETLTGLNIPYYEMSQAKNLIQEINKNNPIHSKVLDSIQAEFHNIK